MAVYGEGHSRPAQRIPGPVKKKGPQLPAVDPPLAWCVWEGMSNPVPVGSPRKSAAIIPFANKTLTSGLPIGSGRKCLMILATWVLSVPPGEGDSEIAATACAKLVLLTADATGGR